MNHQQIICDLDSPYSSEEAVDQVIQLGQSLPLKGVCISAFWLKKVCRELKNQPLIIQSYAGSLLGDELTYMKVFLMKELIKIGANEVISTINLSAFRTNSEWAKIESLQLSETAHKQEVLHSLRIPKDELKEEELKKIIHICNITGVDTLILQHIHLKYLTIVKENLNSSIELAITLSDIKHFSKEIENNFDTVNISYKSL